MRRFSDLIFCNNLSNGRINRFNCCRKRNQPTINVSKMMLPKIII